MTGHVVAGTNVPAGTVALVPPGVYDETIDVSHGWQVWISGPIGPEGSCPDMNALTVRQFWVQDNATIRVECLSTGQVACRQWSIADVLEVHFFGMERTALDATETCRINTARTLVLDSASGILVVNSILAPDGRPGSFSAGRPESVQLRPRADNRSDVVLRPPLRNRTPGWFPFVNSIPAASNALRSASTVEL